MAHGTNITTGKAISGKEHVRQSINDIITTPIGTRVHRRDYGSRVFDLLDRATNPATMADIYMAVAEAIRQWEYRFRLERVHGIADENTPGSVSLTIEGIYLPDGETLNFETVVI